MVRHRFGYLRQEFDFRRSSADALRTIGVSASTSPPSARVLGMSVDTGGCRVCTVSARRYFGLGAGCVR